MNFDKTPDCRLTLHFNFTCKRMAKQIANPALPAPPSGKYPAKSHCRRVARWLAENDGPTEGIIYLEGQALKEHEVCLLVVGCWQSYYSVYAWRMLTI
jgi:hypothetical protein